MSEDASPPLFPHLPEYRKPKPFGEGYPVWSKNKALLIERYLHYFLMITRNGAYIDGFAGPQRHGDGTLWSAKRVLEHEPKWLRNFVLNDLHPEQVAKVIALKDEQPAPNKDKKEPKRSIVVLQGDFNERVGEALDTANILNNKKAAFCLLDQRTFECHWTTVKHVAMYRPKQRIEVFYLLPIAWLQRSLAATTKSKERLDDWWGNKNWSQLRGMPPSRIAELMCDRFLNELKYKFVKAWPIRRSKTSRRIMYFMIHATDNEHAPKIMGRAFRKTDSRVFEDVQTVHIEEFLTKEAR
jgi:three-Cys-motif partner protein